MRWGARISLLLAASSLALASATPVVAQEEAGRRAAINGFARAAGIFAPFAVNPNFDFWPVYSLSEIDSNSSHGVSAGFWPGFLVDATFFQFGYQPFERAFFGVAETLWPSTPLDASAGTHDFERFCRAGEVSTVPLPFGLGEGAFPEPLLTGCQSMYAQYRPFVPWEAGAADSSSDEAFTAGRATNSSFRFGPVAAEMVRASSSSDARGLEALTSEARVLVRDLQIGTDLRIRELRSHAVAVADGTSDGATIDHGVNLIDATFQGEPIEIGGSGVIEQPDIGNVNEQLAAQGIEVRLLEGSGRTQGGVAQAEAGGLVIRLRRQGAPPELREPADQACDQLATLEPEPVTSVDEEIASNPLYDDRPPYNQTPQRAELHESVPPPVGCPLVLMQRALDVGIVLGGASAGARLQPLPPLPTFDFGDLDTDPFPFFGDPLPAGGFGPSLPGSSPSLPSFGEVPPVPLEEVTRSALLDLGPEVARTVRVIYGGMVALLALSLVGRRVFRTLVMQ
ncbi:MAG TPA: hypothetical protein VGB52_15345 [Actinomycetota bacterium]